MWCNTYSEVLFSLKKEILTHTNNIDEPWRPYAELSETRKDKYCVGPLMCDPQGGQIFETASKMVVPRGWGMGVMV